MRFLTRKTNNVMETSVKAPLALPKGSVRAILAIVCVGGFIVACFFPSVPKENLIALSGLAGVVSSYYFRTREEKSSDSGQANPVPASEGERG